jgi:DNA-directed RNA polymerase specialized sigma24 family protein
VVQANNINSQITPSPPKYDVDYKFAQLLISGDTDSWNRFYKEFREKLEIYIKRKYPNVFSDITIEEICDGVGSRLTVNDYKVLKDYRGDCTFSTYITKATDWEIKDWLRKHSEELFSKPVDTLSSANPASISKDASEHLFFLQETGNSIPQPVESLNEDLRWAFLLRYYDYFGFPLEEIRLLAKKQGVLIRDLTKKIIDYLEPGGKDILRTQIEKQSTFQLRLQKLCYEIQRLDKKEKELLTETDGEVSKVDQNRLNDIKNRRIKLEDRRKNFLNNSAKTPVTTPYEIIAEILGEENVSTIRSRVFHAKKELKRKLQRGLKDIL